MRAAALLALCFLHGAQGFVFSCEEIKYKLANQQRFVSVPVVCVVLGDNVSPDTAQKVMLANGAQRYSLGAVANATGRCVSLSGTWTVVTTLAIEEISCSSEIALLFSSIPLDIGVARQAGTQFTVQPGGSLTLVSPEGGMRLEAHSCSGEVAFYTGAGSASDMLYLMAQYNCSQAPTSYTAFENAITVKATTSSATFYLTSSYQTGTLRLGPGDKAVVASSGQADNVQNMHPLENYAVFHLSSDATVYAVGQSSLDPTYNGTILLQAQGRFYNESRYYSIASFNWTFFADTFEVHYLTSVTPEQVWFNQDRFVVEVTLKSLPPNITTLPTTTTPITKAPFFSTTSTPSGALTTTIGSATTGSVAPPTGTSAPPSGTGYCSCEQQDWAKIWLDIVALVDSSASMGGGIDYALAAVQSSLVQLRLAPQSDGRFYSRAAVAAFAKDAQVVRDFSNLTSQGDVFDLDLPLFGGYDVNITRAIDVAMDIFTRYNDSRRVQTRQAILIVAGAYSNGDYKVAHEFKEGGGVIIVINYVQPGQFPVDGLKGLASPGYFFTNYEAELDFHDIVHAFCDINCFCNLGHLPYAIGNNERNVPNGGCYEPVNIAAIQPAAAGACSRSKGIMAAVHDSDKQYYLMGLFAPKTKYWIGLTKQNGVWTWSDNSTEPYTNWQNQGSGDCVYAQQTTGFRSGWFTDECFSSAYHYPCQYRPCDATYYCF